MPNSFRAAVRATAAGTAVCAMVGLGVAGASGAAAESTTTPDTAVAANVFGGNAGYGRTVVTYDQPANGTVAVDSFGNYTYTPNAGFVGTDSFTVQSTDAVKLYKTALPPLGTFGGVNISGGAYGSSVAPVPGKPGFVYGLTDRGPNVDGPGGVKVEAIPSFTPAIAEFQLVDGNAVQIKAIPLSNTDGSPLNGQVNTEASTGETILDLDGNTLAASPNGFDSEGLVAMADGTFYISDEYGPYIWHFDAAGQKIGGYSPYDGTLPRELARRNPNQGMEGLTLTPDGTTLVGLMQSSLINVGVANGAAAKKIPLTRLVTITLATGAVHEYPYLLENPATTADASSEITALSNTQFVVLERDGNLPPAANRKLLYKIDITGATDIGPSSALANATYDGPNGGLLLTDQSNKTLEAFVGPVTTADAQSALVTRGIAPVSKQLYLDLSATLAAIDPAGTLFGHDKVEGVFPMDGGTKLLIANDSDFGIKGVTGTTAPFTLVPKILADGTQDDGEYLEVDLSKLPAAVTSTTETITVAAAPTPAPSPSPTGSGTTTAPVAAGGSQLAATGSQSTELLLAALALIAGGCGAIMAARRRRTH